MEYQKSLKQAKESSHEAREKAATALSAMPSTQVGYSLHCSLVGSSRCRCVGKPPLKQKQLYSERLAVRPLWLHAP